MTIRKDIEILRGLAVIIVLLYHFSFDNLNNNFINSGYIGVDIFFVISGYIISKIIIENEFSIKLFFVKRFKRLLPILLFVILFSLFLGFFLLEPFILNKNIDSSLFSLIGFSNVFFWLNATIYQFAEKNNLLFLHTWSLAIEFQFYLIYPITILLLKKNILKKFIFIIFLISYTSIFYLFEKHNLFNFYSSFSRIFEITAGCLAYLFEKDLKRYVHFNLYNYLYFFGLILIILFMCFLHNEDNHPNPQTLFPILGVVMMILFYNEKLSFINHTKLQFVGLISYSLYLWHFPIIVLSNFYFDYLDDFRKIILFFLCFIVSIASYIFIEKYFRNQSFKKNLVFCSIILSLLISLSVTLKSRDNYKENYIFDNHYLADESNKYLNNKNKFSLRKNKNIYSFKNDYKNYSPQFKKKNTTKILFLGDSYSKDLFNIFYSIKDKYERFEFSRYGINLTDLSNNRVNSLTNSTLFKKSEILFFVQRYKEKDIDLIEDLIKMLDKNGKKLILVLRKPEFTTNNSKNQSFIDKFIIQNNERINYKKINQFAFAQQKKEEIKKINQKIVSKYKNQVVLFDIYDFICSDIERSCDVIQNNQTKNIYDHSHFTIAGSKYFGLKLYNSNELEKILLKLR